MAGCTADEVMAVAAARRLRDDTSCFVGIGLPSRAANLTSGRPGGGGAGVTLVVTDLGVLEPDAGSGQLTLIELHPGVRVEDARAATGWDLQLAGELRTGEPPSAAELQALRALRTVEQEAAA